MANVIVDGVEVKLYLINNGDDHSIYAVPVDHPINDEITEYIEYDPYGGGFGAWGGLPPSLESKLREFNDLGYTWISQNEGGVDEEDPEDDEEEVSEEVGKDLITLLENCLPSKSNKEGSGEED